MGNKNTKLSTPSPDPVNKPLGGNNILNLQEDVLCPICQEPLEDPVSIDCGHNFCSICLFANWSISSLDGYRCPECKERIKSDTCLQSLVEKFGEIPGLNINNDLSVETPRASEKPKECAILNLSQSVMLPQASETRQHHIQSIKDVSQTLLQSGQKLQLMGLDKNECLCLDEEALSCCLEQGQVKNAPVCLISVFGKQRLGKSFLMNFLMRRLQNMSAMDESWMGQEAEPLTGFEWQSGHNSTTKGVWIWSQPFWVPSQHGKVAVFLVDTEGSMDLDRNKEAGVKLSAFSMLLSSYQIFNVGASKDDTDLEYLDMFVYAAETVANACGLRPIQHLDVLVRDWLIPQIYGLEGGQTYLQDMIQKLDGRPDRHSRAQKALRRNNTRCYVMPHPGMQLLLSTEGTLADMEKNFRKHMKDYINDVARSAESHVKRDQEGMILTGAQFATRIKEFSAFMKECEFGFSSVREMAIACRMWKIKDEVQKELQEFIKEQDLASRRPFASLKVKPRDMANLLQEKQCELVTSCEEHLQGDKPSWKKWEAHLHSSLGNDVQNFLQNYGRRYKFYKGIAGAMIGLTALGLAGSGIGAAVAAGLLAAEAIILGTGTAFAIGSSVGAGIFAAVGGGLGNLIGRKIGAHKAQEAQLIEMRDFSQSGGDSVFGDEDEKIHLIKC